MSIIFDYSKTLGKIKPMHAVNNGPTIARADQSRGNFDAYKAAGIPFARNHDASFCSAYGGEHTVDISAVFPNFDADVNDPASYDFTLTDIYTKTIMDAGTEVFYRLGQKIEHNSKKYGIIPPKDFQKWAEICEHIIMHMNEGWADGHNWNIRYWEIWNEPDLDADDVPLEGRRTWGGTEKQFYDFYEIAAKHLKSRFPHLKIGGPASAGDREWAARFLPEMAKRNVPIDFFSWHIYSQTVEKVMDKAEFFYDTMQKSGYGDAESILNEWNYIADWGAGFIDSLRTIANIKGAAFTAAVICASQNSSIDMLMYYDARISCTFNGMFDMLSLEPIKGYYPFKMFNELYKMGTQVEHICDEDCIYAVGAKNENGDVAAMVSYFSDEEKADKKVSIKLDNFGGKKLSVYTLDNDHDCEITQTSDTGEIELTMKYNSVILITSKEMI